MSKRGTVATNRLQYLDELVAERRKVELLTQELEVVKAELRALKGSNLSGYSRFDGKGYSAVDGGRCCKRCGAPKEAFQVYCGAACAAEANA